MGGSARLEERDGRSTRDRHEVGEGEEKQHHALERYEELRGKKDANGQRLADVRDEQTLATIRERFGLAAAPAGSAEARSTALEHH